MKKQKLNIKTNKGITLIALIITIIVLLILAVVSVKLIVDNGIVDRSKSATNKYKIAEEKEKISLAYSEYKMSRLENIEADPVEQDLLDRYFIGKIWAQDVCDEDLKFINIPDVIPDASESIKLMRIDSTYDENHYSFLIKYNNNQYEVIVNNDDGEIVKVQIINTGVKLNIQGAEISGNSTRGWYIKFKSGNIYELKTNGKIKEGKEKTENEKLLERYLLGEGEEQVCLINIMKDNLENFIDNDIMPDASTRIESMCMDIDYTNYLMFFTLRYENKLYKLTSSLMGYVNVSLEPLYEPKGREGQKVKYSYDGTEENEKEWTILYDYGDSVEIISPDGMGELVLGWNDETAEGENGEERVINSYNNAIKRMNEYCASIITNEDKISVRSLGSNPDNPLSENTEMYKTDKLSKWYNGKYNGIGKGTDNNFEQDVARMLYHEVNRTKVGFWLASRNINDTSYDEYIRVDFKIRCYYPSYYGYNGYSLDGHDLLMLSFPGWEVRTGDAGGPVRPVVKISSDSIKQ